MKHTIPTENWHLALADAIEAAADGDVIVVHNAAMKELAEDARERMRPDKQLTFEIDEPAVWIYP